MDNLTHSLTGALIGQAGLKKKTGLAMPALIIGANLPDVDAACFLWLDGVEHLGFRRGITHGPLAWVLLPLVLAGGLWAFDRLQAQRGKRPEGRLPVQFGWLYALSFLACLTHPALDWLNVYGIRLLEPFSSRWFYGDTLFIIDVWLWALLGSACVLSLRREKRGGEWQRPARIALVVALGYIGLNAGLTWANKQSSSVYATVAGFEPSQLVVIASPPPVRFWQRDRIFGTTNDWQTSGPHGLDGHDPVPIARRPCAWPDIAKLRASNEELDAFLFWSRAPFAERAPDGSVILRDARFYDPQARGRFSVSLSDVKCEELPSQ